MTEKEIRGLIILGMVTILTLLSLQVYWVYNSWKNEDSSFNQSVNIALRNVAQSLATFNNSELPTNNLIRRLAPDY
ncbi:MAG: sensor histidine kinase, partial [Bacteroidota bacterium]